MFKFNPISGQLDLVNPTGPGDVVGPASSTDNALVRFDGATGKLIQNSAIVVADNGTTRIPNDISLTFLDATDTNNNSFKTGSDGTFLFDIGSGNSVKIKGGDNAGAESLGYTDTSFNNVWSVNTLGATTQSGSLTVNSSIQCDSIVNDTGLAAGTYTPTRSAETNLDSNVTMTQAQYMRVGNTITVSGRFTADPTLTATATSFEITLPVASNIGAVEDVAGTAFCGAIAGQGAEVIGVVANDTAKIQWLASDTTSQSWSYIFTYRVI